MTYDGTTIRRYVDGDLAGTRAAKGAIAASSLPAALRRQRGLEGVVQGPPRRGPRLRPCALTPAQIATDMTTPINAKVTKARKAKRSKGGANVTRYRGGHSRT